MMGRTHAETGLFAAIGTAYLIKADVPTAVLLCTTLPGTAILNDIDHPDSTVSRTYGPITGVLSKVLTHRRQTHSVPGIMAFSTAVYFASVHFENMISKGFLMLVLVLIWAATLRLFKIPGWLDDFAPIPFAALITFGQPWLDQLGIPRFPFEYLPFMVCLGMLVHVVGDLITHQPIPLWWPVSKRKTALKLFKAGSIPEYWIVAPMTLIGTAYVGWLWIKEITMIEWSFWIF